MSKPVSPTADTALFLQDEAMSSKLLASDKSKIDKMVAWLQQVRDHSYGSSEDLTRLKSLAAVVTDVSLPRCKEVVEPIIAQVRRIVSGENVPDLYKNTIVALQAIRRLFPEYPPSPSPVDRELISPTILSGSPPASGAFRAIRLDSR